MSLSARIREKLAGLSARHPQLQKIVANVGWLSGDRLIRMVGGMLLGAWVARYLGPANFGILNYVVALVSLISIVSTLGIDAIVRRELVRRPAERAVLLGTAFWLKIVGGVIFYIASIPVVRTIYDPGSTRTLFYIYGLMLVLYPVSTPDLFFQAASKSRFSVLANNIAFALSTIARLTLISVGAGVEAFGAALAFEFLATGLVAFYFYWGEAGDLRRWTFDRSVAAELLRGGLPLLASGLAVVIYMKIDQVMLKSMIGDEAVGIYSAALRLTEVWYVVPIILATALFPSIQRTRDSGSGIYLKRVGAYFDLSTGIAYAIAIPGSLLAPWIVHFLFGHAYVGAEQILRLQIWASVFVFLGMAREQVFLAENWLKLSFASSVCGAVANVLLNYFFIPRWAGLGAAAATVISQILATFTIPFLFQRTRPIAWAMVRSLFLPVKLALLPFRFRTG